MVGAKFCPGENQDLAPVVLIDDVRQKRFFLIAPDWVNQLADALHRAVRGRDLNVLGILQDASGKVSNLLAKGG